MGDPVFAALYLTVPPMLAGASFAEAATLLRSQIADTLILNYQVRLRGAEAVLFIRSLSHMVIWSLGHEANGLL